MKNLIWILCLLTTQAISQEVKLMLLPEEVGKNFRISPDDAIVASIVNTNILIWDFKSGKLIKQLSGHSNYVSDYMFTGSNELISWSADSTIRIWNLKEGNCKQILKQKSEVVEVYKLPEESRLISVGEHGFTVWNTQSGKSLFEFGSEPAWDIQNVSFSYDGKYVCMTLSHGWIVYQIDNGKKIREGTTGDNFCSNALFSPFDYSLYIQYSDQSIDNMTLVPTIFKKNETIFQGAGSVILSNKYAVELSDKTSQAKLLSIPDYKLIKSFDLKESETGSITLSNDESKIAVGSKVFETKTGVLLYDYSDYSDYENDVPKISFDPKGKFVILSFIRSDPKIVNMNDGVVTSFNASKERGNGLMKFSFFQGKLLAANTGTMSIIDLNTGTSKVIANDKRFANSIFDRLNTKNTHLYEVAEKEIIIHPIINGDKIIRTRKVKDFYQAMISSQGGYLLQETSDSVFVFSTQSGELVSKWNGIWRSNSENQRSYLNNSDEEALIVTRIGNSLDEIRIIDLRTGTVRSRIAAQKFIEIENWSESGRYLTLSSYDSLVLFDTRRSKIVERISRSSNRYGDEINKIIVNSAEDVALLLQSGKVFISKLTNGTTQEITSEHFVSRIGFITDSTFYFYIDPYEMGKSSQHDNFTVANVADGKKIWGYFLQPDPYTSELLVSNSSIIDASDKKVKYIKNRKIIYSKEDRHFRALSEEGNWLLTSNDKPYGGNIILSELSSGKDILALNFVNQGTWVVQHASGLFDASQQAMSELYFVQGLDIVEFNQLKERYYEPNLWKKVMSGEKLRNVVGMKSIDLPPDVRVGEVDEKGYLPIELINRGGGIGDVTVYIQGKEVAKDVRDKNADPNAASMKINYYISSHKNLVNGENFITVKAWNKDHWVESKGTIISYTKGQAENNYLPVAHILTCGVSDYAGGTDIDLAYAAKDADDMGKAMQLGASKLFGTERTMIYKLTTTQSREFWPTKANILRTFERISSTAHPLDIIVVYLSGHGINLGGETGDWHYLAQDAHTANAAAYSDPAIRNQSTISSSELVELFKAVPAAKQVLIIDACASGKVVDNLIAKRDVPSSSLRALDRMKDRTGMHIITGCTADAVSYEASRYGQGVLTYSLLEGIRGASLREDEFVDVNKLFQYAQERVPALATGIGGIQTPMVFSPNGSQSFDIGQLTVTEKKAIPISKIRPVYIHSNFQDDDEMSDVLELGKKVDLLLGESSAKGPESSLIFVPVREYPDGCQLVGRYKKANGKIVLKLKKKCEGKDLTLEVSGKDASELSKNVIKVVTN